ncbi:hypothetical protein CALCODRAFT_502741 [Calocera cornea HHB12733]|uniref:Uncharacterized protein n=1 Tax=Calocera cornea HHB12733 TaxID=1353952 RepID=A0A165D4U7_9BASI|nr:hypothetical protein CALCODRAFT_502741 [Calocera cornea HHB12733]
MYARQLVQSARTVRPAQLLARPSPAGRSPVLSQLQLQGKRGYASQTQEAARDPDNRAKLAFRVRMRDIPVELYPLGVVVAACVVGASVAITRILMNDPDMLKHRSVGSGQLEKNTKLPETEN